MNQIINRIKAANKVLIFPSDPDIDSIGTSLGLKLWLEEYGKSVDVKHILSADWVVLEDLYKVSGWARQVDVSDLNAQEYDLLIMIDGSGSEQFFGSRISETEFGRVVDIEKTLLFDHHQIGDLNQLLPGDVVIQDPEASCTAEVVYAALAEELGDNLNKQIAESFFKALQGDTGNFRWELRAESFEFAAKMIRAGADWKRMMDLKIPFEEFQFSAWAVQNIELFPEIRLGILCLPISKQSHLSDLLGEDWRSYQSEFKNTFGKTVKGYDIIIVLEETSKDHIKMRWRLKDFGVSIDLRKLLPDYGFIGGGHFAAGGGNFEGTIEEAKQAIIKAIKSVS